MFWDRSIHNACGFHLTLNTNSMNLVRLDLPNVVCFVQAHPRAVPATAGGAPSNAGGARIRPGHMIIHWIAPIGSKNVGMAKKNKQQSMNWWAQR